MNIEKLKSDIQQLAALPEKDRITAINQLRIALHEISPFVDEPVDLVLWVPAQEIQANDYNPNSVAPPEMQLLETSIVQDGYTQPIVTWPHDGYREVVDGFHRNRVGKESKEVQRRIRGYLPVVTIKTTREDKADRIASTIRHNRARGKHKVEAMSDIVVELKRRNWSEDKIARDLGMDADEVLRLCQITGIAELFADQDFSAAWDLDEALDDGQFKLEDEAKETTRNGKRIFHTYEKWECYKAGFYDNKAPDGMTKDEAEEEYATFLRDIPAFEKALERVISEWAMSCEHYLSNESMNRIAWLGQASLCVARKIPSEFRAGYNKLSEAEQRIADETALKYLNKWLQARGMEALTWEQAQSKTAANLY